MSKNLCPFCKRETTKHHPQCQYGAIPSAKDIESLEARKKQFNIKRLKNTKSSLE